VYLIDSIDVRSPLNAENTNVVDAFDEDRSPDDGDCSSSV